MGKGTLVTRSNTVIDDIGNVNMAIRSDNVISVSWEKGTWVTRSNTVITVS